MIGAAAAPIRLVWAEARGGAIGRGGELPWHLPEDLAHFKRETLGSPVVMGRRTWESLPERFRPLPGRANVVVTGDPDYAAAGAVVAASLEEAIAAVAAPADSVAPAGLDAPAICVIGGGQLFRAALPLADELVVTRIDLEVPDADVFAPEIGPEWRLIRHSDPAVSRTGPSYRFEWYGRAQR